MPVERGVKAASSRDVDTTCRSGTEKGEGAPKWVELRAFSSADHDWENHDWENHDWENHEGSVTASSTSRIGILSRTG